MSPEHLDHGDVGWHCAGSDRHRRLQPHWPLEFERLRDRAAAPESATSRSRSSTLARPLSPARRQPVIDLVIAVEPDNAQPGDRATHHDWIRASREPRRRKGREAFGVPEGEQGHHLRSPRLIARSYAAQLAFRDRLRKDRALATEYEELKRRARPTRFRDDRMGYTEAKTDFVTGASRP